MGILIAMMQVVTNLKPAGISNSIQRLLIEWRKWWTVLTMFYQDGLVYRANAVIWIMTDVVTAVTMPLIWLASYNGRPFIQGFTPSDMVSYYLVILALTGFVESHIMWDMANDVKQGRFNIYLTRPFSFMQYMYASNLGWRTMRTILAIPIYICVIGLFHRYLPVHPHFNIGWTFWLSIVLGHLVSFTITYAMGLISLWLYEARSVYNFYYLPLIIFSGQVAPLSLFPAFLQRVVYFMPFPYTLAFPANIFLGRVNGEQILQGLLIQCLWIIISLLATRYLWYGGLKRFTAFGI